MKISHAALVVSCTLAVSSTVESANLTEADEVAWLFDSTQILLYNLVMTEDDLAFLDADPTLEQTVPCNVTVNFVDPLTDANSNVYETTTLIGAGCRYKGNAGSFNGCVDTEGNGYGAKIENSTSCRTLSWKVDSNDFADDFGQESKQRFYGLKKLLFHGIQKDNSMLGERLAYTTLQERLTNSPRVAAARVFVNGDYYGLYNFVEEVDDIFIASHYTEESASLGALWKEVWFPCAGHPNPTFDLDTRNFEPDEVGDDDFTGLDRLSEVAQLAIECLAGDNCDELTAQTILDGRVDTNSFLNALLVNYLMLNWDSAQRFYGDLNSYNNHNYYLYVPQNGSIEYIPWDYSEILDAASCGFEDAYRAATDGGRPEGSGSGQGGAPIPAEGSAPIPAEGGAPIPAEGGAPIPAEGGAPIPAEGGAPIPAAENGTQTGTQGDVTPGNDNDASEPDTPPSTASEPDTPPSPASEPDTPPSIPSGGQGGQGGQGEQTTSASTCPESPHWFDTEFDESLCTPSSNNGNRGGRAIPFACDPVGHIMALAWKAQFLELVAKATREDNFLGGINTHAKVFATQEADDVERYANQGGIPSVSDFQWGVVEAMQKVGTESMYWFTYTNNATSFV
ncbi:hypothetical protein SARC_12855 [Sphaeroforma arctica JP610]|uniref:Spore coat protein CotH n=1 Tax=Sphaeroforma arctica JP610 TaxID=667725 RepID=A0A0L0FEY6_9EUKA|nr:hypothetical protein SARC_12855 [Sphaeroforma arctica JP610]KNC74603.1 hypothetical protein SARC_12855 [Sphaeroforma arctica JP610]|eukprot:XP_014148505.1 hypothetical protein SARC_12855 [Sphaeroforma arctica JP610]